MTHHLDPPPTLEEYRRLEAEGKIHRPLTDDPIGTHSAGRRAYDAANSEAVSRYGPQPPPRTFRDPTTPQPELEEIAP